MSPCPRDIASIGLSGSADAPAFPVPAWNIPGRGAERRGREERSHPEPRAAALPREHGEDGEHRTFPGASTMAYSGQPVGQAQAADAVLWRADRPRAATIASTRASSVFSSSPGSGTA